MKFNELKILFGTNLLEKMKFVFVFAQLLMVVSVVERSQFQIDIAAKTQRVKRAGKGKKRTRAMF